MSLAAAAQPAATRNPAARHLPLPGGALLGYGGRRAARGRALAAEPALVDGGAVTPTPLVRSLLRALALYVGSFAMSASCRSPDSTASRRLRRDAMNPTPVPITAAGEPWCVEPRFRSTPPESARRRASLAQRVGRADIAESSGEGPSTDARCCRAHRSRAKTRAPDAQAIAPLRATSALDGRRCGVSSSSKLQ